MVFGGEVWVMEEIASGVWVVPVEVEFFGEPRVWHLTSVEARHGLVLFDVGGQNDEDALAAALGQAGFGFGDIDKIIVTHHDVDHAGCLPAVQAASGADILAHHEAVPYLAGDLPLLKRPGITYDPAPVDLALVGGETLHTHAGPLNIIHAPGHCPDHLLFHLPDHQILIAADQFHGETGLTGPNPDVTPDMPQAIRSMQPLLELDITTIICFHGGPVQAGPPEIQRVITTLQA